MDRKLRKRRKTTEGPFSENIEKKRKKVGEKQRKDLILRKWKKKKKGKKKKKRKSSESGINVTKGKKKDTKVLP